MTDSDDATTNDKKKRPRRSRRMRSRKAPQIQVDEPDAPVSDVDEPIPVVQTTPKGKDKETGKESETLVPSAQKKRRMRRRGKGKTPAKKVLDNEEKDKSGEDSEEKDKSGEDKSGEDSEKKESGDSSSEGERESESDPEDPKPLGLLQRTIPHVTTKLERSLGERMYLIKQTQKRPVFNALIHRLHSKRESLNQLKTLLDPESKEKELCEKRIDYIVKLIEKIEKDYLEKYRDVNTADEGLYQAPRPYLLNHNTHLLEQRAMRAEHIQECFDENGKIFHSSDPLKKTFTKPQNDFEFTDSEGVEIYRTQPQREQIATKSQDSFRLNVDINNVKFVNQPHMTEEEYLCSRLLLKYREYEKVIKQSLIDYYNDKIGALYDTLEKMRSSFNQLEDTSEGQVSIENLKRKMHSIRCEIKELRNLKEGEQISRINLVNSMIEDWKLVKEIRRKNGYNTNKLAFKFIKIIHNKDEDEFLMREEIRQELQERREDFDYEHELKVKEYNSTEINDEESVSTSIHEPEQENFDNEEEEEKILLRYINNNRSPGEPEIIPQMMEIPLTQNSGLPPTELARRNRIHHDQFSVHLYINGKYVSKTKHKPMNSDFVINFGEIIPVILYRWPKKIELIIFQKGNFLKKIKIASLKISPPGDQEKSKLDSKVIHTSGQEIPFTYHGRDPKNEVATTLEETEGLLKVKLQWTDKIPPKFKVDDNDEDDRHLPTAKDLLDMQKLKKWMKGNKIDPNDPRNTGLRSMLELIENKNIERKGFYLTEQEDDLFIEQHNTSRYKKKLEDLKEKDDAVYLTKRYDVSKYVREPPLPELNMGILKNIWAFFEPRRPLNPTRRDRFKDASAKFDNVNLYVQVIRGHNLPIRDSKETFSAYRARMYQKREQEIELIQESTIHGEGTVSEEQPKKEMQEALEDFVPPPRTTLLPFVQVSFQGKLKRTRISEGSYPQFNQTVSVPVHADEFTPEVLERMNDMLYFDIFDEVLITDMKDDQKINDLHQHSEFRWLGGFSFPFTTIYKMGKILGTFQVSTPPITMGYKYTDETDATTRLTLCITLDPPLPTTEQGDDPDTSGEIPKLISHIRFWNNLLENNRYAKNRIRNILVPNTFGKATLACRFVRPLNYPKILNHHTLIDAEEEGEDFETETDIDVLTMRVARFVAKIPFIADIAYFLDRHEVWEDCQEFVDDGGGDYEEHALLLCNYFKYLKKKAWVVIGKAIPEGETNYVLTHETNGDYFLWNCNTGEHYDTTDAQCPVYEVGMLFDETNIWANIQRESSPHKISFDVTSAGHWHPLFTKKSMKKFFESGAIKSIQPPELIYKPLPRESADMLEIDIQNDIKTAIEDVRKDVTIWATHVGNALRDVCKELEKSCLENKRFTSKQQKEILKSITETSDINGFPLNFAFVDRESIVRQVLNTHIYDRDDPDVRFAIGVFVQPYVNSIYSVWVYIATVIDNQNNQFSMLKF